MVTGSGELGTSVSIHNAGVSALIHSSFKFPGPIWPVGGLSPAARITKSKCTERLGFEWKPKRGYFLRVVDTCLKPSPGRIIAWNWLTEGGDNRSLRRSHDPHVLYNASRFPLKPHSWNHTICIASDTAARKRG